MDGNKMRNNESVVLAGPKFELGEPATASIQYSRKIISETKNRKGNAFKTVKEAVRSTFINPRKWKKVLIQEELEQYLHDTKCMTDPKILDSRKRAVDKPFGNACNIPPHLLSRPLDKCELFDLEQVAREKEKLRKLDMEKRQELARMEAEASATYKSPY